MEIKKILVSQPKPASEKSPYFDIAQKYGIDIVFRPFIKVEGLTSKEFRQQKISLSEHTAVIFTAKSAIDHFFRIAEESRFAVPDGIHRVVFAEIHHIQKTQNLLWQIGQTRRLNPVDAQT